MTERSRTLPHAVAALLLATWTVTSPAAASSTSKASEFPAFDPSQCGDSEYRPDCGLPKGRWLVITKQRSGSRWFVDTMTERTGGLVPYTSEINCKGCSCGDYSAVPGGEQDQNCACQLAHYYSKSIAEEDSSCGKDKHYGYKLMLPHDIGVGAFDVLARSVCRLGIPVVFLWRRNSLRRLISAASNHHDASHPEAMLNGTHCLTQPSGPRPPPLPTEHVTGKDP